VFNAMAEFKNDIRCITMDQRNANGGESRGPNPVDDPRRAGAHRRFHAQRRGRTGQRVAADQ
jgi:hypothetical protein